MMEKRARRRRIGLAVVLFFLAPLVGEYLLGNTPITDIASLFLLAAMYGGGALLIREVVRRTGRGWPTMILFAAAYALLEEGPIDMMLWNRSYGGFDIAGVYSGTYVPALHTSAEMLQDVLLMHTIWSICVPIAIMETFNSDRTRPWLGKVGLTVTAVVFATPSELAWSSAVIIALIVLGMRIRGGASSRRDATAPGPWLVGVVAFGVTSLYWCREFLPGGVSPWIMVVGWCVLVTASVIVCSRWSGSRGWGAEHRLALAGGALLTYVWVGFTHARDMKVPYSTALLGNVVFGVGAIVLLTVAACSLRHRQSGTVDRTPVAA
jgi:hypothetical protein